MTKPGRMRNLVVVLGDQLDAQSSAFEGFDPALDAVWMAEVAEESTHVWSAKQRIALFLSAMRHFAESLRARGWTVHYTRLNDTGNCGTLAAELIHAIETLKPERLVMTAPGDWRVLQALRGVSTATGKPLDIRDDLHFFSTVRDFAAHAKGRKQLRLEYWYRELRVKTGILMEGGKPVGGEWNFDVENRESFGAKGPGELPPRSAFAPDATTQEVIALVNIRFASHPGTLDEFGWPVTREQALVALDAFIAQRLPLFGQYEDAMWQGEVWLYHSHLSSSLNLKLLTAREVVEAAEAAYHSGHAPIAAVEGFIRQILGWREYVRGIYWTHMPEYLERNALGATATLPAFYWTADTDMACLRDALTQTLQHGYAHHIQRLMVTGLYALLFGVRPQEVHGWYLSVYVDAVEWVELPNTLGMSQFGDGGVMASKPYAATGKYIQRMSNHCKGCRYDPVESTGAKACPYTTLYWDFLIRHEERLAKNPRMALQVKNIARLSEPKRALILEQAQAHRASVSAAEPV
ncbi:cryptochrome/photolyase family protein [Polaromonas sp. YR568]|uniref:cryptochrome/photolyase family protein n=1 Tax=Polaromonas sp. YR568 TaxID=1855301 RepID=UPI0031382227